MKPGSGETIDVENVWRLGTWTLVLNVLPLTNNYGLLLCLEIEMILYRTVEKIKVNRCKICGKRC